MDVQNKGCIADDLEEIQKILDRTEQVCAFNAEFDMAFLGELGLHLDTSKVVDTMRAYARKYRGKDFIKFTQAAKECGYIYHAHDALNDCKATLVVQNKVDGKRTVPPLLSDTVRRVQSHMETYVKEEDNARILAHFGFGSSS